MAYIYFQTKRTKEMLNFFSSVNARLQSKESFIQPYSGKIKIIEAHNKSRESIIVGKIEPTYPKIYWIGVILVGLYLIFHTVWLLWFGIFFFSPVVFWTDIFYSILFRIQLYRSGHKDYIKSLSPSKFVEMIYLDP